MFLIHEHIFYFIGDDFEIIIKTDTIILVLKTITPHAILPKSSSILSV